MYKFGKSSYKQLKTLHPDLQLILLNVIEYYDFSILEGIRSEERQQELFEQNRSKLDGVSKKSKHQGILLNNELVSMAVDIMPYKKGYNAFSGTEKDTRRFYFLMGMIRMESKRLLESGKISHDVRFGIDWDSDDIYSDQSFDDAPHLELVTI